MPQHIQRQDSKVSVVLSIDIMKQNIIKLFDEQSHPFKVSGRMVDDGIIDPRDTRRVVAYALDICADAQHRELHPNAFGVARL